MAPSRCATAATSSAGTKRNSASLSTNRLISQGQAIRSTLAFFRVTHFIAEPPLDSRARSAARRLRSHWRCGDEQLPARPCCALVGNSVGQLSFRNGAVIQTPGPAYLDERTLIVDIVLLPAEGAKGLTSSLNPRVSGAPRFEVNVYHDVVPAEVSRPPIA